MDKQKTTLADLINPEVKNILFKIKRLDTLLEGFSEEQKSIFKRLKLSQVKDILRDDFREHKHFEEITNLIDKLIKLDKNDI